MKWLAIPAMLTLFSAKAQFDILSYLGSPVGDLELQLIEHQLDHIDQTDNSSPFFRQMEFRTRIGDLESGVDEYRFRISPLNPSERQANKSYFETLKSQLKTEATLEYSLVLETRYLTITEWLYLKQLSAFRETKAERYKLLIELTKAQPNSGHDLLNLEKRMLFNDLDKMDLESDRRSLEYQIKKVLPFEGPLSLELSLITPKEIEQELEKERATGKNLELQNTIRQAELSLLEWQVNKAESFSNIGFLQANYQPDADNTFQEKLGFQIGIRLPLVNPDRPDLERRKLELIEDDFEVKKIEEEILDANFLLENQLHLLLQKETRVSATMSKIELLNQSDLVDLKTLIELEDFQNDLFLESLRIQNELLKNYIKWLQLKGRLSEMPLVNHLSSKREPIPKVE